jgi:acetyl-CoA C-acetyltransferase
LNIKEGNIMSDDVYILSARRTPIGAFQGTLAGATSPQLGAVAIRAALADSGIPVEQIDEVFLGCVLPAGLGQAPARQASLGAGLPKSVPCTTVNKVCGSGMRTAMMGADAIKAGSARFVVAGGLESMTNAPYLLPKARGGYRLGHGEILDHMFYDGLQNPYDKQMMGHFADATAAKYGFSRADQDLYAAETARRAKEACGNGSFEAEITPVTVKGRKGDTVVDRDETPFTVDIAKIPSLKPSFGKDGTVTAASSSSISDGAAAMVLASAAAARAANATPLARVVSYATFAQAPEWFTTAPPGAIKRCLEKAGWSLDQVDLFEINEAFAVVTMAAIKDLGLNPAKVNVNGGACALGHPIGATGARLMTTLLHALRRRNLKRGIASLCLGGGEATAIALEII